MDNASTFALITILGTVITALFKLLNDNTKALEKLVASSDKVASATTKGANEAKQRNGHLGELVSQGNELTSKILQQQKVSASILADSSTSQHIEKQVVDKQIVKGK